MTSSAQSNAWKQRELQFVNLLPSDKRLGMQAVYTLKIVANKVPAQGKTNVKVIFNDGKLVLDSFTKI
jgi:hypothetical protein